MKKFLKENSYNIVRLFIYQIGLTIFGLVVSMATVKLSAKMELTIGNRWPLFAGSIFAVCFYMFLLFYMTAELGRVDGVRIEGGRLKYNRFKGLYLSLCANSLNILLSILAIIGKAFVTNVGFFSNDTSVEAVPVFWAGLNSVCELIAKLLNGMYLGIQVEYFSGNPLFYLIIVIPSLIACTLAYMYGVKRAMSKNPLDEEKRRRYEMKKDDNDIYYQQ